MIYLYIIISTFIFSNCGLRKSSSSKMLSVLEKYDTTNNNTKKPILTLQDINPKNITPFKPTPSTQNIILNKPWKPIYYPYFNNYTQYPVLYSGPLATNYEGFLDICGSLHTMNITVVGLLKKQKEIEENTHSIKLENKRLKEVLQAKDIEFKKYKEQQRQKDIEVQNQLESFKSILDNFQNINSNNNIITTVEQGTSYEGTEISNEYGFVKNNANNIQTDFIEEDNKSECKTTNIIDDEYLII